MIHANSLGGLLFTHVSAILRLMADPDDTAPTPLPTQEQLDADAASAYRVLQIALDKYIKVASRADWSRGWDAGWKSGREHLIDDLKKGLANNAPPTPINPPPQPAAPARMLPPREARTSKDVVLDFIKDNPGKRGVEIANALGSQSPPMLERTVRTNLARLREDEKIKNVDGRWYAANATPPDNPQPTFME